MKNSNHPGAYSRTMPRALLKPYGGGLFLMSEVPLYIKVTRWHLQLDASEGKWGLCI